jgi:hypothetical protein
LFSSSYSAEAFGSQLTDASVSLDLGRCASEIVVVLAVVPEYYAQHEHTCTPDSCLKDVLMTLDYILRVIRYSDAEIGRILLKFHN